LLAPTIIIILRLLQGFALGGEWGGAATMLIEYAPPEKRVCVPKTLSELMT
jgi:MFS transporter, MHS family, shikimate and dehydroshikimate transport protein